MGTEAMQSTGKRRTWGRNGPPTLVNAHTRFFGDLVGAGKCIIYGVVEGNCEFDGIVTVAQGASVRGNIRAHAAIVAGTVYGDVRARDRLEVAATTRIVGDVISASMAIAEGAVLEGRVNMTQEAEVVEFAGRQAGTYGE